MDGGRNRPRWRSWTAVLLTSVVAATAASAGTALLVGPRSSPGGTAAAPSTAGSAAVPVAVATQAVRTGTVSSLIEDVAARVSPAVVTISASGASGLGAVAPSFAGIGSGIIYRADGLVLTNSHVVEGGGDLAVTLADKRSFAGRVVARDRNLDLAVVRIDATGLPTAALGTSGGLPVGALVIVIGSPLGTFTDSVTSGILSGTGRSISIRSGGGVRRLTGLLQTDAAISEGNSGGPLLNAAGLVVGINTATAASAEGIGFAIPIEAARAIVSQAAG
jgi:S1-C subfamily serine protease